ncbi:MAG: Xaa-Pro peptidase family protein [Candidatus Omnitrophica bacterium]|nr:Xaa-Pro peptidase family protein [Candidatus Omnitrophota bacterium]
MTQIATLPRIPDAEFKERMAHLKDKMQAKGIDLLVAFSNALDPGHVRYLADVVGLNESAAVVVPLKGDPILCSGQACQAWSKHKSRIPDVRIFPEVGEVAGTEYMVGDQFTFASLFEELRAKSSVKRIGTAGTLIFPQIIYAQLQRAFPNAEIVNAEPLMFELRYRKSANEIACMRHAAQILSQSFGAAAAQIQPGWTELDIMAQIVGEILRGGAEDTAVAWTPMIPSGPEHTQLCMNRNTLRKVREGEIICLQAGALYEGYNAALCTPLVLGRIPPEIKRAVNSANEAMGTVIASLKPGVTTKTVNAAGKAVLRRQGYGDHTPYAMVHNIGCLECESPWMPEDKDYEILEGMTVCIDVFLFRLPWGSFRIEDTLAITATGAERLTQFNQSFIPQHYA